MWHVGLAGLLHLLFFLVVVPWSVLHKGRRAPLPALTDRQSYYKRVVTQLAQFGLLSVFVAWFERVPLWSLPRAPLVAAVAAAGLVLLFYAALIPYRRARIDARDQRAFLTAPRTRGDVAWWAAVSLAAGVCEELAYRGVAASLLLRMGVPSLGVVLLVSTAFGLAHANRGWVHTGITFSIGAAVHALMLATGSLLPAIAVHVAHDFLAGLTYARLVRRVEGG